MDRMDLGIGHIPVGVWDCLGILLDMHKLFDDLDNCRRRWDRIHFLVYRDLKQRELVLHIMEDF